MKNGLALSALLMLFMLACQTEEAAFVGSWELDRMEFEGKTIDANTMGNPIYTFEKNERYSIAVDGAAQEGAWKLEGKKLTLIADSDPTTKSVANVLKVDDQQFFYSIVGANNSETIVYLNKLPTSN